MKKSIKAIAAVLAAGLSVSAFTGCGNKKPSANSENDIEISFWIAGFGEQFMDDIIEGFNSKYPDYHAYKNAERNVTTLVNSLKLGKTTLRTYISVRRRLLPTTAICLWI